MEILSTPSAIVVGEARDAQGNDFSSVLLLGCAIVTQNSLEGGDGRIQIGRYDIHANLYPNLSPSPHNGLNIPLLIPRRISDDSSDSDDDDSSAEEDSSGNKSDSNSDSDSEDDKARRRKHGNKKKSRVHKKASSKEFETKPVPKKCAVNVPRKEVKQLIKQMSLMARDNPTYGLVFYKAKSMDPEIVKIVSEPIVHKTFVPRQEFGGQRPQYSNY